MTGRDKKSCCQGKMLQERSELDFLFRRQWQQSIGKYEKNQAPPVEGD